MEFNLIFQLITHTHIHIFINTHDYYLLQIILFLLYVYVIFFLLLDDVCVERGRKEKSLIVVRLLSSSACVSCSSRYLDEMTLLQSLNVSMHASKELTRKVSGCMHFWHNRLDKIQIIINRIYMHANDNWIWICKNLSYKSLNGLAIDYESKNVPNSY